MDAKTFDGLARGLAAAASRRLGRRGVVAALTAAVVGPGFGGRAAAAECRGRGATCRRNGQCCSRKCRNDGTCAAAGVGKRCDPDRPADCRSGACGCTATSVAGEPVGCTCRQADCAAQGDGCDASAGCCDGFCLGSRDICFPRQQQCIPDGGSCAQAPTLCCPGFACVGGSCAPN